jgi:predicted permease
MKSPRVYNEPVTFLGAFLQVAILFILIAVGYLSRKIGVLDLVVTRGFSRFIVNVTLPALAVSSMQVGFSRERLADTVRRLCVTAGCYVFYLVFVWLVPKILRADRREAAIYRYFMFFSNTGFMGYPVIQAFFGDEALFYAVIFNMPYALLTFTVGVGFMIFAADAPGEKRKIPWTSPGILASLIGFALFLMPFRLPFILAEPIDMLGGLTTPLSLIVIGSLLTHVKAAELWKGAAVYAGVAFRLAVIPFCVYAILRALGASGHLLRVPVILSAMPAAANMSILADQFGGGGELASRLVFLSILFSIFSLPVFALLVG